MPATISIRNLGKRYSINHAEGAGRYKTLRESLARAAKSLVTRIKRPTAISLGEDFWALRNVSFDVRPGEVVGIVGRNGAGKSTLLKILSRITKPTTGHAVLRGRVSSLLEVGTGFHPELTGRENIFLNGSVLGMSRREIRRKFDGIVSFAELEKFIDTPVKRYSSGMYVRLAFGVAAHLDPEILIVDEVLAVGDARFQKKCLGTMERAAGNGQTVLFVSHNLQAVSTLCSRAILLEEGQMVLDDSVARVVETYLHSKNDAKAEKQWEIDSALGDGVLELKAVKAVHKDGEVVFDHDLADPVYVDVEFRVHEPRDDVDVSIHLVTQDGITAFAIGTSVNEGATLRIGTYRARCEIPAHFLNDATYYVSAFIVHHKYTIVAEARECASFCMHDHGTARGGYLGVIIGVIRPRLNWESSRVGDLA